MPVDKALLARRFGRAAAGYEAHARVQELAAGALVDAARRRAGPSAPRRLLDVGCGTGLLTARLLDAWPASEIFGLDLAEGMIAVARTRLAGRAVRLAVRDIEEGFPDETFDLVASSMTLQWLHDPAAALRGAAARLGEAGLVAAAVPVAGTLIELRAAYAAAAEDMGLTAWRHPGLDFHEAERWEAWARAAFADVELRVAAFEVQHRDALAVLEAIRGVGGNDCEGGAGPGRVQLLRRALARYDAQRRGGRGVRATWRVAIFTGRGPRREER